VSKPRASQHNFMYRSVPLCTLVSYRFLISTGWEEGGGSSAVMLLTRTIAVMLLNCTGLLYTKPPMTYDLYGPVHNAFDAGSIHYARGHINHKK
jgi:hypothetical protein